VKPSTEATKAAATAVPGEPGGSGWYLKIAAFRERGQADAIARRLGGRGYNSYVVRASGLYSVRVGKYQTRREADSTRRRLEKEEQLKPLISR
jgi:cell division septation protein DedD